MTTRSGFWTGKRVLLTGHTGFKGAWLHFWLKSLGAEVFGLSLAPTTNPSLHKALHEGAFDTVGIGDIRDTGLVNDRVRSCRPEIVIHMAAQPLVRQSYEEPLQTFQTNVMGTINILEACRDSETVRACLVVTSDKCYENDDRVDGYTESCPMGGHDPYSASKGCTELVVSSYARSFFDQSACGLASARAGNVIGGGDWSVDRLIPDTYRAWVNREPIHLRNPRATRPWQHVLDCLSGYTQLIENLWLEPRKYSGPWNFGPSDAEAKDVRWLIKNLIGVWDPNLTWTEETSPTGPHEALNLSLDSTKSRTSLLWEPVWDTNIALKKTAEWYRGWNEGESAADLCSRQIQEFESRRIFKN